MQTISNQYLVVKATEIGAELNSIKTKDGTELLWQGNPEYWSGKAPNLFPYVARLVEGKYKFGGKEYALPKHGFARKSEFNVAKATENTIEFELSYNSDTLEMYPVKFVFKVIYALNGPTLNVTYYVKNLDKKDMYFGLGAHPGFNVPFGKDGKFEDYKLCFSEECKPKRVLFDEKCFVTGELGKYDLENGRDINLRHNLFDDDAIVLADTSKAVTLQGISGKSITVAFPNMRYIGFWHAVKTDAPYVCIEPWVSLPATTGKITEFEQQSDLVKLAPDATYENTWSITVGEK